MGVAVVASSSLCLPDRRLRPGVARRHDAVVVVDPRSSGLQPLYPQRARRGRRCFRASAISTPCAWTRPGRALPGVAGPHTVNAATQFGMLKAGLQGRPVTLAVSLDALEPARDVRLPGARDRSAVARGSHGRRRGLSRSPGSSSCCSWRGRSRDPLTPISPPHRRRRGQPHPSEGGFHKSPVGWAGRTSSGSAPRRSTCSVTGGLR